MKTTLRKLIKHIDFTDKNLKSDVNWEDLSRVFNIDLYWSENDRLKVYFIKTWWCTDSRVGLRVYFLDDEFVCLSEQNGRKHNEDFEFYDNESVLKVKTYLQSLVEQDEDLDIKIIEDLDVEIDNTYKIEYNTQILHKTALYDHEKVEITKRNYQSEGIKSKKYFHTVEIKFTDGTIKEVSCLDLDFEYNSLD